MLKFFSMHPGDLFTYFNDVISPEASLNLILTKGALSQYDGRIPSLIDRYKDISSLSVLNIVCVHIIMFKT